MPGPRTTRYWCEPCNVGFQSAAGLAGHKRSSRHVIAQRIAAHRSRQSAQNAAQETSRPSEGLDLLPVRGTTWAAPGSTAALPCDLETPAQQPDSVLMDIDDIPNATTAAGSQAATAGWEAQGVQEDSLSEKDEPSSSEEEDECFTETDSDDNGVCLEASQSDSFTPCAKLLLQAFATMSASAIDLVLRVMHHPHLQSADIPWKTAADLKRALDSMKVWFWNAASSCDLVLNCC